ncbi:winged helix-turn-helix domain-containing protein [Pseudomonas sp. H11T01]|uniref:winged helix-turn-helix domain-containing protein n=1 Tax=Pseudomonas sp. H11T01 TaxID=3402749 RepID=UPI003AC37128
MMLKGKGSTTTHGQTTGETRILTIGRTHTLAEGFRQLVANHVRNDIPIDTTSYSHLPQKNQHSSSYRAIFVIIDSPHAFLESLAVVENVRAENLTPIISVIMTGRGTYNKMKYHLAGADHCIKFSSVPDENVEVLSDFFCSTEWQREISLVLDPTRMCLHGLDQKLEISFAEMKVLEALTHTKNHILSHDEIASVMGLNINFYDPRALEKSISRLRGKIKSTYGTNAIQSIRGHGYRLSRGLISSS